MRISDWSSDVCSSDLSIVRAIVTASRWAAYLGPEQGTPRDFWRALFEHTYSVELRVEAGRAEDLLAPAGIRFDALLAPAWNEAGIAYVELPEGVFAPQQIGRASCRERVGQYV